MAFQGRRVDADDQVRAVILTLDGLDHRLEPKGVVLHLLELLLAFRGVGALGFFDPLFQGFLAGHQIVKGRLVLVFFPHQGAVDGVVVAQ
jgi:hypothetical protein